MDYNNGNTAQPLPLKNLTAMVQNQVIPYSVVGKVYTRAVQGVRDVSSSEYWGLAEGNSWYVDTCVRTYTYKSFWEDRWENTGNGMNKDPEGGMQSILVLLVHTVHQEDAGR